MDDKPLLKGGLSGCTTAHDPFSVWLPQ